MGLLTAESIRSVFFHVMSTFKISRVFRRSGTSLKMRSEKMTLNYPFMSSLVMVAYRGSMRITVFLFE